MVEIHMGTGVKTVAIDRVITCLYLRKLWKSLPRYISFAITAIRPNPSSPTVPAGPEENILSISIIWK